MKEDVDFDKQFSNFGMYIDEISKDFKKEKEEKKEIILKFKELFSIDTQMKNFVNIFEYLENEIITNKGLLLSSMKWNYVLLILLRGSKVDKVEKKIKELDKETKYLREDGMKWVFEHLKQVFSELENKEKINGDDND